MNTNVPHDSTEFHIYGIIPYESINGNYSLIMRSVEDPNTMVSITIGSQEAQSIAIFLDGPELERPLTHDLFCNVLLEREIDIDYVSIDDGINDVFFASIVFNDGVSIDCRPSDGISIAIRMGSPVFINNSIVDMLSFQNEKTESMKDTKQPSKKKGGSGKGAKKQQRDESRMVSRDELEKMLQDAILNEEYELAAKLRDEIAGL